MSTFSRHASAFPDLKAIRSHFKLTNIQEMAYALNEIERSCCYEDFERSSRFCEEALKAAGFSKVERIEHKADGITSAFDCVMPMAWDFDKTRRSYLEIVSPTMPEGKRLVADSSRHPQNIAVWSSPTPPGGVTAELVEFNTLPPGHYEAARGKWLLYVSMAKYTSLSPAPLLWGLYRKLTDAGVAGIVFCDMNCADTLPNELNWQNGIGYTGWYPTKGEKTVPFFSITPLVALRLMELLKRGPVTLHGEMNCRYYDGRIHTVTGIIPGESQEEIALMAHLYEPFVNDDAAGFSFLCELGRQLVERKVKPKRTLRVIFSMELYGMAAYLEKHDKKVIMAANFDGIPFRESFGKTVVRQTPCCCAHFSDWFNMDFLQKHLPDEELRSDMGSYSDDTFPNDPYFGKGGIPTFWLHGSCKHSHHNTGYLFGPDWPQAARKLPIFSAIIEYYLCAETLPDYAKRAAKELREAATRILKDERLSTGEKRAWLEAEHLRQTLRLRSVHAFTGQEVDTRPLGKAYDAIRSRTDRLPKEPALTGARRTASRLVPTRGKLGFPFSLAAIPLEEREPVFMSHNTWAFFDGKRTLLDCIRMSDAETGRPSTTSSIARTIAELRRIEKYGYVSLKSTGV